MFSNIKKGAFELLKTLSSKTSFFSSKRLERFNFVILTDIIVIGTFIYLIYAKTLTALDAVILITPLLVAAGFNMKQTEKAKKIDNEGTDKQE